MATTFEIRKIVLLLMKRPITEDIAIEVKSIDGYKHLEITDGDWDLDNIEDEMTTGEQHGWIETLILNALSNYALTTKSGRVYPGDVTFVLSGDPSDLGTTREPDVAFVLRKNLMPTPKFILRAPDLAVEIVSPSQDVNAMRLRLDAYFQYGTQQAWLVLPSSQQIEVHFLDGLMTIYKPGQTISGGDLLPGFTIDVAWVFQPPLSDEDE